MQQSVIVNVDKVITSVGGYPAFVCTVVCCLHFESHAALVYFQSMVLTVRDRIVIGTGVSINLRQPMD